MSKSTIGTCSLCGGPVQVENPWFGVVPPLPTCGRCGATGGPNYGPVIPSDVASSVGEEQH